MLKNTALLQTDQRGVGEILSRINAKLGLGGKGPAEP